MGESIQRVKSKKGMGVWMPPNMLRWLRDLLPVRPQAAPRLQLLDRIALAPRHTLALVESEGRRFLIATSPEGAPAFHALDDRCGPDLAGRNVPRSGSRIGLHRMAQISGRVSW